MNTNVLRAVFTRNFVSYFANPTGYVFICVFVLLSGIAAFWPNEFFNANLANLDQLNKVFPFIMLIFIPAITMGIWAEERRQSTDELLLTIPAGDFDIVLGKYLAALSIYSVSLLFSMFCNFGMLMWLSEGNLDVGLFLGTYVGYWLIGLAMLSIGMVASFLTSNLTVGYILGALFNAPVVFAVAADSIFGPTLARQVQHWSVGRQFADFGRGVISLSGITYFLMILVVMLYLSMVLIGRRHWLGVRRGVMAVHYLIRTLALVLVAVGLGLLFEWHDVRADVTSERLNSLSPKTRELLNNLQVERPVQIEAFISPEVPESYVQTRLNLLSMLQELEALGDEKIEVEINETEQYSSEAARAEQRYGISPRQVSTFRRGALSLEKIFMHVAVSCGLQKVDPIFFDRGLPVEYELVRSIGTVSQQERKRIGVVNTDVPLYGRFNMATMSPGSNWPIIDELEKQYEVVQVDLNEPLEQRYDVLLAVQPSSLGPEQWDRLVATVKSGQPTAIFEDPMPIFAGEVPPTSEPRRPPTGNPMFGRQPPPPKVDELARRDFWESLGVTFSERQIIWQDYNPYPKAAHFPEEFVFIDQGAAVGGKESEEGSDTKVFNQKDPITSKLQHMLFPFPGFISEMPSASLDLKVTPLVHTGTKTGTVEFDEVMERSLFGSTLNERRRQFPTWNEYVLAVRIRGKEKPGQSKAEGKAAAEAAGALEDPAQASGASAEEEPLPSDDATGAEDGTAGAADQPKPQPAKAAEQPVEGEASGPTPEAPAELDSGSEAGTQEGEQPEGSAGGEEPEGSAGGEEPEEEEKEPEADQAPPTTGPIHVVLVADIDMLTRDFFRLREQGEVPEAGIHFDFDNVPFVLNVLDSLAGDNRFLELRKRRPRHRTLTRIERRTEQARQEATEARENFIREFKEGEKREEEAFQRKIAELENRKNVDPQQMLIEVALAREAGQRRLDAELETMKQKRDRAINRIETELALEIRRVQDSYKFWAVALPPIPPLLLAVIVFFVRRVREREGVASTRLR